MHVKPYKPDVRTIILKAPGALSIFFGLWAFISVFVFGIVGNYEGLVWNNLLVGFAVIVFASARVSLTAPSRILNWIGFLLGVWLISSSFVLAVPGYTAFFWDQIFVGVMVTITSLWR